MQARVLREQKLKQTRANFQGPKGPKLFFTNVLGVETLEDYQDGLIETVAANDRTAIAACHDVGKSFLMARLAMWFLNSFPNSKVITTAPTFTQVEKIIWSEIRAAHLQAKFPLGGKLNLTEWSFAPDWFAQGLSVRNEAGSGSEGQGTASSFQGFHAPGGIMVLFDEATGIPKGTWTMAEGLLTQHNVKFVAIGNPTSAASEFYKCFSDPAWAKVYLSCFDSPNMKAAGITTKEKLVAEMNKVKGMDDFKARAYLSTYPVTRPYLLTSKWVVQNALKWGIDHPLTVSKILGKFPKTGTDALVGLDVVEQAQRRVYHPKKTDRKTIGVDVARLGTDSSVLTPMHGKKVLPRSELHQFRTRPVIVEVLNMARDMGGVDVIVVDETGLGGGVVDGLLDEQAGVDGLPGNPLLKNTEIRGVQFGSTDMEPEDKEKFANLKARMFGLLKEDMGEPEDEDGIQLPEDSVYTEELPTIRTKYGTKGQLVIESKDDYKKRTGRDSPDSSDSLALANYGHYDELKIGAWTKDMNEETAVNRAKPLAGGLKSNNKKW